MPAALCADRARRWARRPQRSRSDEKDEATAALAATTPPSLPPSSSMGPPRALAPRARRPATTTPPSLPPSPPMGPPRAPAPPLSCLTPDAGGELTGNPKEDWLLRAGTTWTEYPQLPNGPYTSPQRDPPPRHTSLEPDNGVSGMASLTLRVCGPIAGGHDPEDKQAGPCSRAPARRGSGGQGLDS